MIDEECDGIGIDLFRFTETPALPSPDPSLEDDDATVAEEMEQEECVEDEDDDVEFVRYVPAPLRPKRRRDRIIEVGKTAGDQGSREGWLAALITAANNHTAESDASEAEYNDPQERDWERGRTPPTVFHEGAPVFGSS